MKEYHFKSSFIGFYFLFFFFKGNIMWNIYLFIYLFICKNKSPSSREHKETLKERKKGVGKEKTLKKERKKNLLPKGTLFCNFSNLLKKKKLEKKKRKKIKKKSKSLFG